MDEYQRDFSGVECHGEWMKRHISRIRCLELEVQHCIQATVLFGFVAVTAILIALLA